MNINKKEIDKVIIIFYFFCFLSKMLLLYFYFIFQHTSFFKLNLLDNSSYHMLTKKEKKPLGSKKKPRIFLTKFIPISKNSLREKIHMHCYCIRSTRLGSNQCRYRSIYGKFEEIHLYDIFFWKLHSFFWKLHFYINKRKNDC